VVATIVFYPVFVFATGEVIRVKVYRQIAKIMLCIPLKNLSIIGGKVLYSVLQTDCYAMY